MSKVVVVFLIFVVTYTIESVPVPDPDNSIPYFENFPVIDTQHFQNAIIKSLPNMDVIRTSKFGNGAKDLTASFASVSDDGHGHLFVRRGGKSFEKSFRK